MSPKMCQVSQRAGDSGELTVWFQSASKDLEPRAVMGFQGQGQQARGPGRDGVPIQVRKQERANAPVQRQLGREDFLLLRGRSLFLFYAGSQLVRWSSPTLGRANCLTQSTYFNVTLTQKYPHRNIQNNVGSNMWALCDPVNLTRKINHHT